ncbi:hypothetical protein BJV74DRAFT_856385 [Russula compacta]|nr:hypothetical protein BJV74DRAFT_856385 [Russula compacta]
MTESIASPTDVDGRRPCKKRLCSDCNTVVALSLVMTNGPSLSDMCCLSTPVNRSRRSSYWTLFISSCQLGCKHSLPVMLSHSTSQRRDRYWLHICYGLLDYLCLHHFLLYIVITFSWTGRKPLPYPSLYITTPLLHFTALHFMSCCLGSLLILSD